MAEEQNFPLGSNAPVEIVSSPGIENLSRLTLTSQQRTLLQALEERNLQLAVIYQGGIIVLSDASNPDRFSLSAHALRELMEKLPEYLDVSTSAQKQALKPKVQELHDSFNRMKRNTACMTDNDDWSGQIDSQLSRFLKNLGEFFKWFVLHNPSRREEFHGALMRLDGSGRSLPRILADLNVEAWSKKREFFQAVAHHRKRTYEAEFNGWLAALEIFLLERLVPRTFEDFSEIDALLNPGGDNA